MSEEKIVKVFCKDCQFCEFNPCNETYRCRVMSGLYRKVDEHDYCSFGEALLDE